MDVPAHEADADARLSALKAQWEVQQDVLRDRLVTADVHAWSLDEADERQLRLVGGVDISFIKGNAVDACASLVVLDYPSLRVVYEDCAMVKLTQPYMAGFLAFREVEFLLERLQVLKENEPDLYPEVILVDGNGVLHPRGLGLAAHLGVVADVPTVGIGKTLLHVDGICTESVDAVKATLRGGGDSAPLVGNSGRTWGAAVRSTDGSPNPIYVSIGHRVSLDTAIRVATSCCKYRIPEPVRQADQRSRTFLRDLAMAGDAPPS